MNVNTNMNMNLNNVLAGQLQGYPAISNNQQAGINKNDFLKMLKMMMLENENPAQLPQSENTGINTEMLMLLAANGMVNKSDTDNVYQIAADEKVNTGTVESDKKNITDKLPVDLYGIAALLNPVDSNVINPQAHMENMIYNMPVSGYLQPYTGLTSYQQPQNNGQGEIYNGQQASTVMKAQDNSGVSIKAGTDVHSFSAEKLIAKIEESRSKLKNEIDFKANLLSVNNRSKEETIITVSDEASEIKPQVLSQVKEKIVFMAEDKPDSDVGVKYVTMELQPHSLGKVDIKMAFEGDKITVEIKAANKETQKILQSNVQELADILNKASKTPADVVIKVNDSQYENRNVIQNHDSGQQEQHSSHQNSDDANQQGRNRESYHYHSEDSDKDEDGIFSQMINLRNIKINT